MYKRSQMEVTVTGIKYEMFASCTSTGTPNHLHPSMYDKQKSIGKNYDEREFKIRIMNILWHRLQRMKRWKMRENHWSRIFAFFSLACKTCGGILTQPLEKIERLNPIVRIFIEMERITNVRAFVEKRRRKMPFYVSFSICTHQISREKSFRHLSM